MSQILVVVAKTEGGLTAAAANAGATLVQGSAKQFSGLTLQVGTGFAADIGDIDTGEDGWIAFATVN